MLYKHLFSILCGHLNLNQKRKKIEFDRLPVKPTGIPAKPVGSQMRRTIWICTGIWPVSTGFRWNRSGLPEPECSGLGLPVGEKNPGHGQFGSARFFVGFEISANTLNMWPGCFKFAKINWSTSRARDGPRPPSHKQTPRNVQHTRALASHH